MPESNKYQVRLTEFEEEELKLVKSYISFWYECDERDITNTEAIKFSLRYTFNRISTTEWKK